MWADRLSDILAKICAVRVLGDMSLRLCFQFTVAIVRSNAYFIYGSNNIGSLRSLDDPQTCLQHPNE